MKKIILLLLIFLLISPVNISADRGSIPYLAGVQIFEPSQDALIAWNGDEEILILSTELYASETTKILQVLPLPSEPEVKKSSRDVLRRANQFIIPETYDNLRQPLMRGDLPEGPAAEIKEEVVIGSHDILVVEVLNQDYFVSWVNDYLKDKGEMSPQIPESLKKTIDNYIKRGYNYFVFDTIEVSPEPQLNEAISYKFKTDQLYYPLEITKSDHGESEISLFVLTDQNLINYNGIEKNRVKEKTPAVSLMESEVEYISTNIAELFKKDIQKTIDKIDLIALNNNVKLLNWQIKDDLANFNADLLVDSDFGGLLKNKIVYQGTTYLDYHPEENYPYPAEKELETLSGQVEIRMGSRMYPWLAYSINGQVLFNAQSRKMISNFNAEGKEIRVRGYRSKRAQINMRNPIDKMPVTIDIENVFYVTEIVGWKPYSGIALSSDGQLNDERSHFWLENK